MHLRHQRHRKLPLITIIKVLSTFLSVILPNVHRFKKFLSLANSAKNGKNMAVENFTTTQTSSYTTLCFFINHDISLRMWLVFGH